MPSTSDIFVLLIEGVIRLFPELQTDRLVAWKVQRALVTATFNEWARFTKSNLQDVFQSASLSSRRAGARNSQYARVGQLPPISGEITAHCYLV